MGSLHGVGWMRRRQHGAAARAALLLLAMAAEAAASEVVSSAVQPTPDSWDIMVIISRDAACLERTEELLLLDGGCYSNKYSNLTQAYQVKLTGYGNRGQPWRFDLNEYEDNCYTMGPPQRTLTLGVCERFAGGIYAQLSVVLRSNRCQGRDCSKLPVGVQQYYSQAGCQGAPMTELTMRVPLRGECLRYRNGTRSFLVDSIHNNISQMDFPDSNQCGGVQPTKFAIDGRCYPLYPDREPRSFRWIVQRAITTGTAVSGAGGAPALHLVATTLMWASVVVSARHAGSI
mmetsp:Transcript_46595/g.120632  ORF Transcript_46595/g.120632 Transcript_46595/m.120632 type:complete len:288 (-) Transcript_46595:58-921(-)